MNLTCIKNFPKKKTPSPDDFTGKFQQIFKKEIIAILHNSQNRKQWLCLEFL